MVKSSHPRVIASYEAISMLYRAKTKVYYFSIRPALVEIASYLAMTLGEVVAVTLR
jgi:hypothetical protein